MEDKTIGELIYEETKKRLGKMEESDYDFPKTIGTCDWVIIVTCIVVSMILIILCMVGVIA